MRSAEFFSWCLSSRATFFTISFSICFWLFRFNFYRRHFDLPPSSVDRMTGVRELISGMTNSHKPHSRISVQIKLQDNFFSLSKRHSKCTDTIYETLLLDPGSFNDFFADHDGSCWRVMKLSSFTLLGAQLRYSFFTHFLLREGGVERLTADALVP